MLNECIRIQKEREERQDIIIVWFCCPSEMKLSNLFVQYKCNRKSSDYDISATLSKPLFRKVPCPGPDVQMNDNIN
jgi:hypothetical protein